MVDETASGIQDQVLTKDKFEKGIDIPVYWIDYLEYLNKKREKHQMMMNLKELEMIKKWKSRNWTEKLFLTLGGFGPNGEHWKFTLQETEEKMRPQIKPTIEDYFNFVVSEEPYKEK